MRKESSQNYIIELFIKILPYWKSILIIMFIAVALMYAKLYFTPSVYESYTIIKVKVNENKVDTKDLLRDSLFKTNTVGINQEMALLKTFKINKKALEKVDFSVKYFKKEGYRKKEIYYDIPIKLTILNQVEKKFINYPITIEPLEKGFILKTKKDNNSTIYPYNEKIKTPYFVGSLKKIGDFTEPIDIKLQGDNRQIYENIIKSSLSVSQVKLDTNLIKVSFQDTFSKRANQYLDALIDVYIDRSILQKNSINSKILDFLEERLAITKKKLEKSENELEEYQSNNKAIDPSIKSKDSYGKLSDIELELSEIQLKEKLISNLLVFIEHNRNLDSLAPTLLEFNAQSTLKLITDIQELQAKADDLSLEFTDKYPPLIKLHRRINRIRKSIVLNVKNFKHKLEVKRKNLLKKKSKYEKILTSLPKKEKNYINFKRNYEVNSKIYTYLLEKKSENELVQVATLSDYEAVDKAYSTGTPIKPKRMMLLIISGVIGIVIGIFISLLRSLSKKKINTLQDIEEKIKLPFYGKIPIYDNRKDIPIGVKNSYKELAINLQFSKKNNEGDIILITSSLKGEGKTTTLINLTAILVKEVKQKTIIVDLNMIKPSLHKEVGMDLPYSGMSTYLSNRDNLGNIRFGTSKSDNLDIITAGPVPPDPFELMNSSKIETLLNNLKREYDYILIDTPSFEDMPEILNLIKYVDRTLVIIRKDITTKTSLEKIESTIKEKRLKNIGLVFQFDIKLSKEELKPVLIDKPHNKLKQLMM